MGERQAATVVAAILQRGEAISSAGGYLRDLTRRAQAGQFALGPMLMALIGRRRSEAAGARRSARDGADDSAAARSSSWREARSIGPGMAAGWGTPGPARRVSRLRR